MSDQPLNQSLENISHEIRHQVSHSISEWYQSAGLAALGLPQKDFAAAAKEAFQYADTNNDGILTHDEIRAAIANPDPHESHRDDLALRIMDGNWDLLSGIEPKKTWMHPFASNITPESLDKAQSALDGDTPLSSGHPSVLKEALLGGALGVGIGYASEKWHEHTQQKELDQLRTALSPENQPVKDLAKKFFDFESKRAKGLVDGFRQKLADQP